MAFTLGIDLGSSSVKVALVDSDSGECVASATYPEQELEISSPQIGFAEQDPREWWRAVRNACAKLRGRVSDGLGSVKAIGIAYQMHGLVVLDDKYEPLRPAIIWCDSRAVAIGEQAAHGLGDEYLHRHIRNSPGNFTASKFRWVIENQPDIAKSARALCLPGDYIALCLTGVLTTTASGLSEGMLWDFVAGDVAHQVLEYYKIDPSLIPPRKDSCAPSGELLADVAHELGLPAGIPVSYRGGDQPNNAASLNVLHPGEVAATAGTSGVIYAVSDSGNYDKQGRVNVFLHLNSTAASPRYGTLLCINGCGILNSWIRKTLRYTSDNSLLSYQQMDQEAADIQPGSLGLNVYPYGNGAERSLGNKMLGASFEGLDLNRHQRPHLYRAAQEGIVFALYYGIIALTELGIPITHVRAGFSNMFRSSVFQAIFCALTKAPLSLYDTDGAVGAARAAGLGAGYVRSWEQALSGLKCLNTIEPDPNLIDAYHSIFEEWKTGLERKLANV